MGQNPLNINVGAQSFGSNSKQMPSEILVASNLDK